jgi:hypothetical protein
LSFCQSARLSCRTPRAHRGRTPRDPSAKEENSFAFTNAIDSDIPLVRYIERPGRPIMAIEAADTAALHPETRLVHAGTLRSQFGETSEALFLTQGHVYDSAEQCEARFLNKDPGFQYARFSNPTVTMLEQRMAAFEGAEACRATATGMAAVTAALSAWSGPATMSSRPGAVRLLSLHRRGPPAALWRRVDAGRRHRLRRMAGGQAQHQSLLPGKPGQPDAGGDRHRRRRRDRQGGRRQADRRQRLRDAAVPAPARTRRRRRGLFGHQAHRRAGALSRRPRVSARRRSSRTISRPICARPARPCRPSTPG